MILQRLTVGLISIVAGVDVNAYELGTHAGLTINAYEQSSLGNSQTATVLSTVLGLELKDNPFGDRYYDIAGNAVTEFGAADAFESKHMPEDSKPLSVPGWLMRGAIREDDYVKRNVPCKTDPQHPPDGVNVDRPVNHFYDPINDMPLAVGTSKAFDWALGTSNAFTNPNTQDAGRDNHYTVFDAREAMFRALTGMNNNGSEAIGAGGSTPNTAADKEAVRKAYWATTFRALGDLVHLIQDMAQPQHTRQDPHLTECPDAVQAVLGGKSVYEDYVEARAAAEAFVLPDGGTLNPPPLKYVDPKNPYPIPRFNDYVSYFATRHLQPGSGDATVLARRGLADYSNRGFFTARTNFNTSNPRYDLPPSDLPAYGTETVTTDWTGQPLPGSGATLLTHAVTDSYAPGHSRAQVPLTTLSVWDGWLQNRGFAKRYRLNRYNYDAMANLLIPRAVAYSAGLIDYFFRGRMEILLPDEGVYSILDHAVEYAADDGFRKIKLKLRNITPAINDGQNTYPQAMNGGTLWAVVKFHRNGCYQPDLSGQPRAGGCDFNANRSAAEEIVVSAPIENQALNPDQTAPFTFDFSETPIPVSASDMFLQVVYRGGLGEETDAVVVATKDIAEPTFVAISNYTDYFLQDGVFYYWEDPELCQQADYNGDGLPDEDIEPINLSYSFNFGGPALGSVTLPPARHCQIAVLTELPEFRMNIFKQTFGYWMSPIKDGYWLQNNTGSGGPDIPAFVESRGFYRYINWPDWKYSRNGPPSADSSGLPDFADTTPVAVNLTFE